MNLVWFLTIATFLSVTLGEFGHFPFGSSSQAISLTDILLTLTIIFFLIWKIGIKKKITIPNFFKLLLIFPLIGLLSLIVNFNFGGGEYLIRYLVYLLAFLVSFYLVKEKQIDFDNLTILIVLTGLILSFLGILQLIFYPDLEPLTQFGFDPHKNRLVSTFLDPNLLGAYLNISLVLAIYLWEKFKNKWWIFGAGVLFAAFFLTFSRSAYLMFLVEAIIYGLLKSRKIILLGLLILVVLYFVIPQFNTRINGALIIDQSAQERIASWQNGLNIFQKEPVLGVGFNNLRTALVQNNLVKVFSENGGHSGAGVDSSFIFILATTGVIGFLGFVFGWGKLMWEILRKKDLKKIFLGMIVLGILINSQFINSLFYPPIMLSLFFLFGGSLGDQKINEK